MMHCSGKCMLHVRITVTHTHVLKSYLCSTVQLAMIQSCRESSSLVMQQPSHVLAMSCSLLHCRYIQVLAHKKVSNGWGETVVRGIFANWLVCIATWQANAAQDLTGKAVAVWLPISAFAMLGFEHCIGAGHAVDVPDRPCVCGAEFKETSAVPPLHHRAPTWLETCRASRVSASCKIMLSCMPSKAAAAAVIEVRCKRDILCPEFPVMIIPSCLSWLSTTWPLVSLELLRAANMFLIPMAIALGAPISARGFMAYNLIPGG